MSKNFFIGSVGIDIFDVSTIKNLFKNKPDTINGIFTPKEIADCLGTVNKYISFAAIYAAKKSIIKSLGSPGSQLPLNEIEIINNNANQFTASIKPNWQQKLFPGKKIYIKLSLNISKDFIIAQATVFTKKLSRRKFFKKTSAPSSGF